MSFGTVQRTLCNVFFGGVDITSSLQKHLLSLIYTDNEEDESDDIQIKLADSTGLWTENWLNTTSHLQADTEATVKKYNIIAKSGVVVHGEQSEQSVHLGTLAYGSIVDADVNDSEWTKIKYSGTTGYIKTEYLNPCYISPSGTAGVVSVGAWKVGDAVTVTGTPQYTSYGTGTPGKEVTNYQGSITVINDKENIPYPIHVGSLGWFAASDIVQSDVSVVRTATTEQPASMSIGLKIQASILQNGDGLSSRLDCGQFELDSVSAQGPPAIVTIRGTALPYCASIRQTKKSKSWEKYNFSGILKEIAQNNSMTSLFLSAKDPFYKRVEQNKQSDISFLRKLCQDAGFSLKATNNMIVVFDQKTYEAQEPIKTITRGSGYIKYSLSTGENEIYTSCRVSYVDSKGKLITATAYAENYDKNNSKNQQLEIEQKVADKNEALALAENQLRLHNKFEFTATFTFPGDVSLVAGCTVMVSGWGAWDGKYIIKQAKHSVSKSGGYTTQISMRKTLKQTSDIQQNTDKSIDELAQEVIRGNWGNGEERRRRLTEAGYDYTTVQNRVNEIWK